jgi:hypothetical protein
MSYMRFSARLDTFHGQPHPFIDVRAVADSLTGTHNAMVKCLIVVKWSCVHRGVCF